MAATPEWRRANRERLRAYLQFYRKRNHAVLELKRKCRLAGVKMKYGNHTATADRP